MLLSTTARMVWCTSRLSTSGTRMHRFRGIWSTARPSRTCPSEQFHTFGVRVAPDIITFYLDSRAVWQVDTPQELQRPPFPLIDLALGSGFPIDKTPNPSVLLVDYVHMFEPISDLTSSMHEASCQ
jgi:Glycosyl hydrolases family 16